MGTTYRRIKAVDTTFEILEYLADQRGPVTGAQVAFDLKVPFPTVMCHLATAQDRGYVQVVGEQYRLGMKLAVFWARMKSLKEGELQDVQRDLDILNGNGGL
ncbi:helix-turn-helix domain-containing protein [uncultured Desulfobacter sp.]|uniref:helix-turn-helix domain-containing protein n=1 Tax=uncultured Desulfobacter sp. TaxID=240139 RepID=UPI002AAAB7EE|nr:helix-turn-helix domain-containing protein [uncultured Desulfobacter sp.]